MNAREIRAELLGQHAEIRALIEEARGGSKTALVRLGDAVRRHNLREEELLGQLLPTLDAWGPVRTAIMLEEHVAEHGELYAVLLDATRGQRAVAELVEHLLEHMAYEEKTLLAEDLLDDSVVTSDSFGG